MALFTDNLTMPDHSSVSVAIRRVLGDAATEEVDVLAVEEPLEIRVSFVVGGKRKQRAVSITMRTPGHDAELAAGFLFTEGLIRDQADILSVNSCRHGNVVRVHLHENVAVDLARLERHFYTSSSCGVCGKASIDAVRVQVARRITHDSPMLSTDRVHQLPEKLRRAQAVFDQTGGLHASALFRVDGELMCVREDVGRHNALDKLIGHQLLSGCARLNDMVLLVSGRVSFELVQKAAVAGIPILLAVGAPSSLAIDFAKEHDMTVLGFVRKTRFNIYCGEQRIHCSDAELTQASVQ